MTEYTVKKRITYTEFEAVVNKVLYDVFRDGEYHPEIEKFSRRIAILNAFCPDYDMSDCADDESNDKLFEKVFSDEANGILSEIHNDYTAEIIYFNICDAIDNAIDHRRKLIENSPMSLSDYALSKLFESIDKKVSETNISNIDEETIKSLIDVVKLTDKEDFANKLIEAFENKGYLHKPNRTTRRKNIQSK